MARGPGLRIAMVCPYDYTLPGGVQSHIRDLSREMAARGHHVRIIAPRPRGVLQRELGPCVFVGARRRVRLSGSQVDMAVAWGDDWRSLRQVLREEAFDVVHHHTMWNPFLPLQVWWCTRQVASVATFHDAPPDSWLGRLAGSFLMPAAGAFIGRWMVDAVLAVSQVPGARLGRFLDARRVAVVPNGVDVKAFCGARPPRADGPVTILFLGRLEERKGVRDLLEAHARLERRHRGLRLVVAGEGCLEADLRRRSASLGAQRVEFVGLVSEEEKVRLLAGADIFCSPARYGESFGIVLLEAMASGCAVVAAANPGYRQVMRGEGARGLVPPADVDALEARLDEFIGSVAVREAQAAWGLAEVRQYDWSRVAGRVEEAYHRALAHRRFGV